MAFVSCPKCGKSVSDKTLECIYCGCLIPRRSSSSNRITYTEPKENVAKCPWCGSTSIQAVKKGFGLGRAALGTLVVGPLVGVAAGLAGSNKIQRVCLNCGKKW